MSCGTCHNKNVQGASDATNGPAATGGVVEHARCSCGAFMAKGGVCRNPRHSQAQAGKQASAVPPGANLGDDGPCPNCGETGQLETQDGTTICHACGWQGPCPWAEDEDEAGSESEYDDDHLYESDYEPEEMVNHAGVAVYHTMTSGTVSAYHYTIDPTDLDTENDGGKQFDIRDLPKPKGASPDTPEGAQAILRAAIQSGALGRLIWRTGGGHHLGVAPDVTSQHPPVLMAATIQGNETLTEITRRGVEVYLGGYGTSDTEPGQGSPIFVDVPESGPAKIYMWGDIGSEEPTHVIPLSRAAEPSARPTRKSAQGKTSGQAGTVKGKAGGKQIEVERKTDGIEIRVEGYVAPIYIELSSDQHPALHVLEDRIGVPSKRAISLDGAQDFRR